MAFKAKMLATRRLLVVLSSFWKSTYDAIAPTNGPCLFVNFPEICNKNCPGARLYR